MTIEGSWDCVVDTPVGVQKSVLTFKKNGMAVTGQGSSGTGEATDLRDVSVDGDKVSWTVSVQKPMKLEVKVTVTVTGNTATGKAKLGLFGSAKVNMTKRT